MTEINKNLHSFEINNIEKSKINKQREDKSMNSEQLESAVSENIVADTGVLGRSQIRTKIGADVSKSVNEAVELAKNNPVLMEASEDMFNSIYKSFLNQGMEPSDAYMNALLAEEEFCQIGCPNKILR